MPRPCHSESDFSGPLHARHGHGMTCELASAIQRWHVGDLPVFGYLATTLSSMKIFMRSIPIHGTSSLDISRYHVDFHEGHGAVREWHVWISTAWHGRGTVWVWHGMCELALSPFWKHYRAFLEEYEHYCWMFLEIRSSKRFQNAWHLLQHAEKEKMFRNVCCLSQFYCLFLGLEGKSSGVWLCL
jgi:hypothetical protein